MSEDQNQNNDGNIVDQIVDGNDNNNNNQNKEGATSMANHNNQNNGNNQNNNQQQVPQQVVQQIVQLNKEDLEALVQRCTNAGLTEAQIEAKVNAAVQRRIDEIVAIAERNNKGYTHDQIYVCDNNPGLTYYLDPRNWNTYVQIGVGVIAVAGITVGGYFLYKKFWA